MTPGSPLGPYEIISTIGAGGMGVVYRARDPRLGRDVAIKALPAPFADDPERVHRFQQEARAVAALNHPHICQIYDVGPAYLVLELVDGVPPTGPMAVKDAVRVALQIVSALEAAHSRGILHRDLKPANILVTPDGTVKVLDFGLAKVLTPDADATRTVEGAFLGTPPYMSPEQAQGRTVDARSDIFSFGTVLYEMLAGRRAFPEASAAEVVSAVLRDEPAPLHTAPTIQRVVSRCLAKRPDERFQTMGELRVALEQVTAAESDVEPSIAVLPFANLSADKENEYFSDGLTEEIINALTHVPGLKVTARTSSFAFRGKEQDIRAIARALGVRTIVEGSVRRAGSRIRVTAQLINALDGYHIWSERYDREMADVFAVQDEISGAIARALEMRLTPAAAPQPKRNLEAYEHYLKAQYYAQRWTPDSMARARVHFERAIALDPGFALAHSKFAHYFTMLTDSNFMAAHDAMPLARAHALEALEIDPSEPEAQAMLGVIAGMYDYDWQEAERRFRIAMAREPVPARVRMYYVHRCLLPLDRVQEGLAQLELSMRADPLNLTARVSLAVCLRAAGRVAESEQELRQLTELDEHFWFAPFALGMDRALEGRFDEARPYAEKAYALGPSITVTIGLLAATLARLGETERSHGLLQSLLPGDGFGAPLGLAVFHLQAGNIDEAALWTERAIEQRQPAVLFFLKVHGQKVRASPRWPRLAGLLHLP